MYQNHRSREHNKNGLQPCTKTIDPENTMKMDYSHVPQPSIKRTQNKLITVLEQVTFDETKMYATVGVYL